jgi:hypothetical protein
MIVCVVGGYVGGVCDGYLCAICVCVMCVWWVDGCGVCVWCVVDVVCGGCGVWWWVYGGGCVMGVVCVCGGPVQRTNQPLVPNKLNIKQIR